MEWKRQTHEEYGTVLIETFSHEHRSGKLIGNLARKLPAHGVSLSPTPSEDVFAVLKRAGRVEPFISLVATFLEQYKCAQRSLAGRCSSGQQLR